MANMIGILHSGWAENVHFPTLLGRCCCYLCIIRLYEKDHKLFVRKLLLVHRPSFFLSLLLGQTGLAQCLDPPENQMLLKNEDYGKLDQVHLACRTL